MKKTTKFFQGFKEGQRHFGESITVLINSILLSLAYFLGIGITSIIAKISKKHFLQLKPDKKTATYWEDLNLSKKPMEEYYRQF